MKRTYLQLVAVMERDRRITGTKRGQNGSAAAPPGFELNNPWKVRSLGERIEHYTYYFTVGDSTLLDWRPNRVVPNDLQMFLGDMYIQQKESWTASAVQLATIPQFSF